MDNNKEEVISKTADHVKSILLGESSGHDWWHIYRVWKLARNITEKERADLYIVELAALLHDIADWKFTEGDEEVGPKLASEWLEQLEVNENDINHITEIIKDLSYKGAKVQTSMKTLEGKVVQDADRLDAMGAIGIARCFAYGGHKGREIYNPEIKPQLHDSAESYKNNKSPSINHFYEKLLLIKSLINTKSAEAIAQERHEFMEFYLETFFKEWDSDI
ncbi:MAG TPA: HD domain-containing protein [Candidatus Dojkabacteria bacterium]|nr:HD domain-containing protein [Candidatus Dojkabacteria bacterium]HRO65250.1 HD domain-containing protein [Candidatus Dojkabacteria bacterium]HRP37034.1 HD domain-containing protein [Candidatus Dojkabacteria bacterium]HRP51346.1 HD domain-containing protein [Candidatus Dojkabacteria bacterium]